MIQGFADERTESIFNGTIDRKLGEALCKKALKRLTYLDEATKLTDLYAPPSNDFHSLGGNLDGFYAIKVDPKWRIIFRWPEAAPTDVQLVDYH